MLYSKNGSIPKSTTDGTEGWVEVPDAPAVPEGKELAWLNNEWVVRDPKPADRPGYQWNWAHDALTWVECEYVATAPDLPSEPWQPTEPTTSGSISDEFNVTPG